MAGQVKTIKTKNFTRIATPIRSIDTLTGAVVVVKFFHQKEEDKACKLTRNNNVKRSRLVQCEK